MKKASYVKPVLYMETFVPNQRIANCGAYINPKQEYVFICSSSTSGLKSCNEHNSKHNKALSDMISAVFATGTEGCKNYIDSTDPDEVNAALDKILLDATNSSTDPSNHWYMDANGIWHFNGSDQHIITLSGVDIYNDPMKS